ncbi:hypothetical protein [Boudabousia marimammalium]|uniref:hypothetical protein n=1 Tax=Boudabousia marimammalium TaxID=156892 RepID=UPI000B164B8A|nr:hypothetical protein [Boudabousia marimammalium]
MAMPSRLSPGLSQAGLGSAPADFPAVLAEFFCFAFLEFEYEDEADPEDGLLPEDTFLRGDIIVSR